jgi:type IV fimbrial biogenesis protein FimT
MSLLTAVRTDRQAGFTLLELMVGVTIIAILLAMAVPSFTDAGLPSQLRSVANDLVAASQLARSEAIKRNTAMTLCVSPDGATCGSGNWNQGWILLATGNPQPLHRELPAPNGYRVTPAGGAIALTFQATGIDATSETFTICRKTPKVGSQERVVTISAVGRASVQTTTAGVCN